MNKVGQHWLFTTSSPDLVPAVPLVPEAGEIVEADHLSKCMYISILSACACVYVCVGVCVCVFVMPSGGVYLSKSSTLKYGMEGVGVGKKAQ